MSLPIVENLSGPQESIFNLSRGPQLHFGEKSKNWSNFIKFIDFPPFPLFGVPWAAVIGVVVNKGNKGEGCGVMLSLTPCGVGQVYYLIYVNAYGPWRAEKGR